MTSEAEFKTLVYDHGIYTDNIRTCKGFYAEKLNTETTAWLEGQNAKAAFLNVDCDLYESAKHVFPFMDGFLQEGSIIYLDDAHVGYRGNPSKGVLGAFNEHRKRSKWRFKRMQDVSWFGRAYLAIAP